MGLDATTRRRWFGALVLLGALAMLVAGETVLQGKLRGLPFLCYWLACFGLTVLAILIALQDARAMALRAREQQRHLLQSTVDKVIEDAKSKQGEPRKKRPA